ncbi:pyridoxal-dependent decarboxylase conserved domain-containing protein [Cladochytrium replicatum]|nr:pyridoxal-dependent decarboxylase conserved domain-containing protein [Cladochytrium replicatum]
MFGTTSCGAVDDSSAISDAGCFVVKNTDVSAHVDAVWAGVATVCVELPPYLEGTEKADSFSINMDKWGLTNFECCCFWEVDALSLTPPICATERLIRALSLTIETGRCRSEGDLDR